MPTAPLPADPNLENLRNRARALQRAVKAYEPEALAEVAEHHPSQAADATFPLNAAQLVVARSYGFASWARLKRHLEVVDTFHRDPQTPPDEATEPLADRFCRLACLGYSHDDGPERWEWAQELLTAHPEIRRASIWAAAAAADVDAARELLAEHPWLANQQGGPHRWEPLFTLAYSRIEGGDPVETARLLLTAGADPNAGYLWKGLPTPFTVLTGVFGEGEEGPGRQPRHPASLELAPLLLDGGANPNDGQALYNRMFFPDNDHLELLLSYGLGEGDGGVWKKRLGDALESPEAMLRGQLRWAVLHGFTDRVRLLMDRGVDFRTPFTNVSRLHFDSRTPIEVASVEGHREIVELFVAAGVSRPIDSREQRFVAACLAADRDELDAVRRDDPTVIEDVRAARPGLMVRAAEIGRADVVAVLAAAGFDPNGRTDGSTALHEAAWRGDVPVLRALLAVGADPNVTDERFESTPLEWAEHGYQQPAIEVLSPVTRP